MKSILSICTRSEFGAQGLIFPQLSLWETSIPNHRFYRFLPLFSMAQFDEERSWDIYAGSKGAFFSLLIPPGSLDILALKLAPSTCWNLLAALFNDPADFLYVASIF
ncbi:hypothetical protein PRUPE_4G005000 [Prunus persica]|uniref:Uncharacterized protein n=1 Tax=Prunus persica TaxID=3760 RepID=A0A251PDS2_PRUPE|nr:hypothetical protein PRUPE_4G005000 [Prunus persica]